MVCGGGAKVRGGTAPPCYMNRCFAWMPPPGRRVQCATSLTPGKRRAVRMLWYCPWVSGRRDDSQNARGRRCLRSAVLLVTHPRPPTQGGYIVVALRAASDKPSCKLGCHQYLDAATRSQ